ncbi:MAG: hypothetical protein IKZ94_09965, partial [Lachnospiraceae bacterium]|nr:hypothetical protein [Lachnospiraceae bacterium]
MKLDESLLRFNVTLYGDVETLSPTLSKCRLRIFYRGLNRNRTFISEDFARQLIESLPYAPIKGIFDKDGLDYEDHGKENSDGRIYGIVPEDPNFAWEKHVDKDGIEREYACADVYLYTALYPEANLIPGKSQSMEIHKKGLEGEWKIWSGDGEPYFEFQKGHLLGLQVLGDDVEPCFEGSAFFSLYKDAKEMFDYLKNSKEKEESRKMEKNIFRLSDGAKCDLLFDALNSTPDDYKIVCDIYDDYAIAYDAVNNKYLRAYYTKDNEANTVTIDRVEDCYIVDVTDTEMAALNAMKAVGTYAEIQAKLESYDAEIATFTADKEALNEQLTNALAELETYKKKDGEDDDDKKSKCAKDDDNKDDNKKDDDDNKDDDKSKSSLEEANNALQAQLDEFKSQMEAKDAEISRLNNSISDLNNEKSELESFKKSVDTEKKTAI